MRGMKRERVCTLSEIEKGENSFEKMGANGGKEREKKIVAWRWGHANRPPRFKAPGPARYISFRPSLGYDHLRGCVIPLRLRLSVTDTSAQGHTYGNRERDARECVHITACRRICFDHIPSSRIIGSAMYKVFFRVSSSLSALYERVMIFCDTRSLESHKKDFITDFMRLVASSFFKSVVTLNRLNLCTERFCWKI